MFYNSIKEINRLKKETNRLLSKGMSNIYLKVTIEKRSHTQNCDFKSLKSLQVSFDDLQLTQTSMNFQTFSCN